MEAAFPIGYLGVRWSRTDASAGGGIRLRDADGAQGEWTSFGDGGCSVANGGDGLPAHDADGRLVTALHVGGFNSGNLGIALLGTFTEQGPREAAHASPTRLVKVLVRQHGVDPQARVTYTNPLNGTQKEIAEISGHRDRMATECPGEVMYQELERLSTAVATGR